jgi:Not1 N-terminal domain, CCR4-Not complex component
MLEASFSKPDSI